MKYYIRVGKQKTGFEIIREYGNIVFGNLEYTLNIAKRLILDGDKNINIIEVYEGETQKRIISVIIEGGIK